MIQRFIMLVGISGSGKTTYAKHFVEMKAQEGEEIIVLSSDDIREEIYGDASIQTDPARVFSIMNERTFNALEAGRSVIYDATNLMAKRRKEMVDAVRRIAPDCLCICICCATVVQTCIERQKQRDRLVSAAVIRRQNSQFQEITYDEGWDRICNAYTDDNNTISRSWLAGR